MNQITLHTQRLVLRPLAAEHKDFLFRLDSDPDVMKHVGYGKPLNAEDSAIVHRLLLETASHGNGSGCWVGFSDNNFVGWWVLCPHQTEDTPPRINLDRAEFGLRVLPKFWGQGFAKEGSRELIRHGFQDLGIKEIFGDTMTVNAGSRATMSACGMRLVRTFYNHYETPPVGIEEGEVEYRITLDEWTSLQRAIMLQPSRQDALSVNNAQRTGQRAGLAMPLGVAV
ncbi:acyl-CoA N-acyltransferase [Aureobasidium pullulans]|uniref:Acyl-CoA N-acyltransferase n=1 Tax=Aureobasidium pullulans TaxID=5580 RepID=A0A4S9WTV9_AURPU|nr:acyl-CoA N-acyltransferase [Aureobasidium pullulans]